MGEISSFESRTGKVSCSADDFYNFVTDIRNFERFIPVGKVRDIKIAADSVSFRIDMLGTVSIRISEKLKPEKVLFSGNALHVNDFNLSLNIRGTGRDQSDVKITLTAELNIMFKMIAAEPVKQFLETLMNEIEKFRDWKNIR